MTAKWYKQYCTAGVQKLPYHAVCTYKAPAQPLYKHYCTPSVRKLLSHAACTCMQYGSDAPTAVSKKSSHQINQGAMRAEPHHQQ
jgi:hypothetical protein